MIFLTHSLLRCFRLRFHRSLCLHHTYKPATADVLHLGQAFWNPRNHHHKQ